MTSDERSTTVATGRFAAPCLVIGIGNEIRGDDAAGIAVARRVREAAHPQIEIAEADGDVGDLLGAWADRELVILVDATSSGGPAGGIVRYKGGRDPIPNVFVRQVSSHGLGLSESLEIGAALDLMPRRYIVYGVEGSSFDTGADLTKEVAAAVDEVSRRILDEVAGALAQVLPETETGYAEVDTSGEPTAVAVGAGEER